MIHSRHERPKSHMSIEAKLDLQVVLPLCKYPTVLDGEDGGLARAISAFVDGPECLCPVRGRRFNEDLFDALTTAIIVFRDPTTV